MPLSHYSHRIFAITQTYCRFFVILSDQNDCFFYLVFCLSSVLKISLTIKLKNMNTLKRNYGFAFPALIDEFLKPEFHGLQPLGMKIPAVNIKENEDGFALEMMAPGLKKSDFNLELNQNTLTISVESKKTETEKSEKFTRREFQINAFKRSFTLPENIEENQISANYEDGILHVSLPIKKEINQTTKRLIEIS